MESKKKKIITNNDHESKHLFTPPKLPLLISRQSVVPDLPTPPPRTAVSVPFDWEEAPGKPRHYHTGSEPMNGHREVVRTLELPPRLLCVENNNKVPSPTTVLDGPYVGRAMSFTTSFRSSSKDTWNGDFGSSRWSGLKKNNDKVVVDREGSFDFSSWTVDGSSKVKITRVKRRASFLNLSQSSHLLASIYESFKQVVPWKRRQSKCAPKIDTI